MTGAGERYSCDMLIGCTGYFSYENPYEPKFPGQENFSGTIVHPQKWTPEHDRMIEGKRVALIGSGATAVTLVPAMADSGAGHVTMLQRNWRPEVCIEVLAYIMRSGTRLGIRFGM